MCDCSSRLPCCQDSRVCRFIGKFSGADMKQPVRTWGIESDQTRSYRSGRPACHSETTYFLTLSPCSPVIGSYAKHSTVGSVYLSNYMIWWLFDVYRFPQQYSITVASSTLRALYLAEECLRGLFVSPTVQQSISAVAKSGRALHRIVCNY
ncbi:hypothetical protein BDV32DRAFT_28113 [Aspergillus pseudonomiae]|uniref:Uncharacterized protein n=1 Tax=Aspergillus pseudonomiae TaxID=1506151 RepID=A0A5N7D259_9EURO|nr:uncharacterized protein BDV37DRAFT_259144 [Aspergillus pseudonomiae]KAB8261913.1 hypothetical protein BDV32DRAFT_28113 [Aspergillus pseudonomiae]KAE8399918.1 hypothetical protein BDV37DRAFT_259144 [Aspergillus pseudonomiae]